MKTHSAERGAFMGSVEMPLRWGSWRYVGQSAPSVGAAAARAKAKAAARIRGVLRWCCIVQSFQKAGDTEAGFSGATTEDSRRSRADCKLAHPRWGSLRQQARSRAFGPTKSGLDPALWAGGGVGSLLLSSPLQRAYPQPGTCPAEAADGGKPAKAG